MNQNQYFLDMKPKIVDSHCHLDFKDFSDDLDLVIKNAKSSEVEYLLSISIDFINFEKIYEIASKYKNIWCTTGVHPNNVPKKFTDNEIEKLMIILKKNLSKKKVVGVGETGLDFFRSSDNKNNQISYFDAHLYTAAKNDYPVIVHTREADVDTINCIDNSFKKYSTRGLIHCFSSTKELASKVLDNGFYISFSGIVTFKKASNLIDIVKYVPLDRILIETDAPYLAPEPFRGKRNEPSYVIHTLKKIAEIKKIKNDELAKITTENFFSLFTSI